MREAIKELQSRCQQYMQGTTAVVVLANDGQQPCPICAGVMQVQKTATDQIGKTLQHGTFVLWETFWVCAAEPVCRHASGKLATRRSKLVSQCLIPNHTVGYDVMVFVGLMRYVDRPRQQREEIHEALQKQGIPISTGEVSRLAKLFLYYLRFLHDTFTPQLRKAMECDGGYPMHLDASCEAGRGTVLGIYAGWRDWILDVAKISSENSEEILVRLRQTVELFDIPLSIMSDMGNAMLAAITALIEELGPHAEAAIVRLICHLHFVRDVGKDLLKDSHSKLCAYIKNSKLRARLRDFVRTMAKKLNKDRTSARQDVYDWLASHCEAASQPIPSGSEGLAILHYYAKWLLDYKFDGHHEDFPFSQPCLHFYDRCLRVKHALDSHQQVSSPIAKDTWRALDRLHHLVSEFCAASQLNQDVQDFRKKLTLWNQLREALRLVPVDNGSHRSRTYIPRNVSVAQAKDELQDVKRALEQLCNSLRERYHRVSESQQQAIDVILQHVITYNPYLWGHVIELQSGELRVVDRTDNRLENLWGSQKGAERRRSGHKNLTYDLETMPADAILTHNLTRPDYLDIVCNGSLDNLAHAFYLLDANLRQAALKQPYPADQSDWLPSSVASMFVSEENNRALDRTLIRSQAFAQLIHEVVQFQQPPQVTTTETTASIDAPQSTISNKQIPFRSSTVPPHALDVFISRKRNKRNKFLQCKTSCQCEPML